MEKTQVIEIYPAPPLTGDGTISEIQLLELANSNPGVDVYFSIGNLNCRRGDLRKAAEFFRKALALEPQNARLRANLGITLLEKGSTKSAVSELKKSLLADKNLLLAHLALAKAHMNVSQNELALAAFHEAIKVAPDNITALIGIAQLLHDSNRVEESKPYYRKVLSYKPEDTIVQAKLALFDFEQGKGLFEKGELLEAFELWGKSYRRFPLPYATNQLILNTLSRLVEQYNELQKLKVNEKLLLATRIDNKFESRALYQYVQHFLFSINLLPEAYESMEELDARLKYWHEELPQSGDIPYPHFRLGIIFLLKGEFESALREIDTCKDKFPEKKLRRLHLKLVRDAIVNLNRSEAEPVTKFKESGDAEWKTAGFDNEFETHAWKQVGLEPSLAMAFKHAGFSPRQSTMWNEKDIQPAEAAAWREAGFEEPGEVKQWIRGNFSPADAAVWQKLCPLPLDLLIQSKKAGFEDPVLAFNWSKVFSLSFEAIRWHEAGFSPEEAILWREQGFTEPMVAARWKVKGHSPDSALKEFAKDTNNLR